MAKTDRFNTGFLILEANEEVFLSVTPGFERGPGIQRDGITAPRMSDPHAVPRILNLFNLPSGPALPPTTDPYVQRAGTWTLYQHARRFVEKMGREWLIVGIQSNGDLTMNPWHVAYLGTSHLPNQQQRLCALLTDNDPQEPVSSRIYRCLVKWADETAVLRKRRYECLNLRVEAAQQGRALKINDTDAAERFDRFAVEHGIAGYNPNTRNIAPLVNFALSGKPVVEEGRELALANAIDRFEDIRHIFNLPTVPAEGFYRNQAVHVVNFGEYQLFANLNERRAALSSPVIVNLDIDGRVKVAWEDIAPVLRKRHFHESLESPTRRGEFRRYLDQADHDKVEIFFPHNVYPFGVLGIQNLSDGQALESTLVSHSSGGLSGRVGTTLEGITRVMYDFFGCTDAMVLDEGYDVFFVTNPARGPGQYCYDNDEMLRKILTFTRQKVDADHEESLKHWPGGLKGSPLNRPLVEELDEHLKQAGEADYADVMMVQPQRTQIRSVLIFATRKPGAA